MPIVSLKQINKKHPAADSSRKMLLNNISLTVDSGEFLCILGPSGCGKSTLLNIIAGLVEADSGCLYFNNQDISQTPTSQRNISMIFQDYALYQHMNVFNNIAFPLQVRGENESEIARQVIQISKQLQIEDKLERYPTQLSTGEQQRVAMARGLIKKPGVFLLDEPFSNLDQKLKQQMLLEVKRHHKLNQCTSIFVTHEADEVMALADRVVLMREGEIIQVDTPLALYEFPCNQFAAEAFGQHQINLLKVTFIKQQGQHAQISLNGFLILIRVDASNISPGSLLTLGFRAESIFVGSDDDPLVWIKNVQYQGHLTYIHATLDGSDERLEFSIPGSIKVQEGSALNLKILAEKAHLFTQDGKSLPRTVTMEEVTTPAEMLI
ncbi:ABC transporter ATP-binding protein [Gayadomonas joobiniege]|uniref:ABC transporter ATP-binding protein n=1 Tax=Gayadomonas joobiniege TaxID=1234606 RepID=UPI00036ADE0C|nr:ABC transporter ATP-binding protein [Gayadomonas joobiniege]